MVTQSDTLESPDSEEKPLPHVSLEEASRRAPLHTGPILARLIRESKPYLGMLFLAMASSAAFAASRYVRAYLIQPLLDDVLVPGASMTGEQAIALLQPKLIALGIIATLTVLVTPIAMLGKSYLSGWVMYQIRRDMDQTLARKFLRLPLREHRAGSSGDLLARAMTDLHLATLALNILFVDLATNLMMIVAGGAAMLYTSWLLAVLTLTTVPPLMFVLNYFGRRIRRHTKRRQETQGDLSQRLVGILSGIKVIKAFRGYEIEEKAFALETDRFFKRAMKVMWNQVAAKASTEALTQTVGFAILATGAWLALNKTMGISLGTLAAFAVILMTTYKPVKAITTAFTKVMESLAGAQRYYELIDASEEIPDRPGAQNMNGLNEGIRIKDVHFGYDDSPILRGIDLDIAPGEVIAIVGKTGNGKSTLLDLLLRFHDPDRGSIEIDGTDLRDLRRESFLDHVAVVTQEPFLFDISILENIRYGRPAATFEEVQAAARAAQAEDFIEELPEGYETPVGEFGLRLSGGQRQRITIARAILRNPAILVFDEATSALDGRTERAVQTAIEALRGQHTIFLVSHRLSTIRDADRIVVLHEGRVAEIGDYDSLVSRPGLFRDLLGSQGETSAA